MFLLSALSVFFLTILLEILVVLDLYATAKGEALKSALYTGLCTVTAGAIILIYVSNKWMLAVDTAGAMVGAYIAVKYLPKLISELPESVKSSQATSAPIDTEQ